MGYFEVRYEACVPGVQFSVLETTRDHGLILLVHSWGIQAVICPYHVILVGLQSFET